MAIPAAMVQAGDKSDFRINFLEDIKSVENFFGLIIDIAAEAFHTGKNTRANNITFATFGQICFHRSLNFFWTDVLKFGFGKNWVFFCA